MFFSMKSFDDIVKEMKSFGNFLMPYSQPKVDQAEEEDINILKSREVVIDGYSVVVHYNKNDWPTHYMEIVQISGKYTPYLPFYLVCKIGKKFLGNKHLSYLDYSKDGRKTYCWTLATDKANNPMPTPYRETFVLNDCVYEGLCYKSLVQQTSDKKK